MNINNISTIPAPAEISGVDPNFTTVKDTTGKDAVFRPEVIQGSKAVDTNTAAEVTDAERSNLEEAMEMAEVLNEYMDDLQTNIGFHIREDMNRQVVVEIKDKNTNELIKQIPTEEMLKIKEKMEELTGLIFDQSV